MVEPTEPSAEERQRETSVRVAFKNLSKMLYALSVALGIFWFQIAVFGYDRLFDFHYVIWLPLLFYVISTKLTKRMAETSRPPVLDSKTLRCHIAAALTGVTIGIASIAILSVENTYDDGHVRDSVFWGPSGPQPLLLAINAVIIAFGCGIHFCGILLRDMGDVAATLDADVEAVEVDAV